MDGEASAVGRPALRLGLLLPSTAGRADDLTFDRLLDGAAFAEEAGFDGVWLTDHLYHGKPMFEAVTTLALVLSRTSQIDVGTAVMQLALRPAAVVAREIGTLACYAPGRLRIGIGVGGEYPREWEAAGVPLSERGARTTEAVTLLRRLLAGETVSAQGRFNTLTDVRLQPAPSVPVPLQFAGRRPGALRRAALLGDGWIGAFHTPGGFARDRDAIVGFRAEAGLPVAAYELGMFLPLYLDERDDGATERALDAMTTVADSGRVSGKYVIAGTPETVVGRLGEFMAEGCSNLVLEVIPRGAAWTAQAARLAELLPTLREEWSWRRGQVSAAAVDGLPEAPNSSDGAVA